ncbi:hypothetical protein F0562_014349 [Nyssa sinensis]|uniref:Uncharacterized protein n=1 Tax=Nyssa sinensis TaxID=561372 RepID=A0A5J4ZMK5_9ASTE|nr:hypothetical protein F0562_014349 [Nyssa sinensis]
MSEIYDQSTLAEKYRLETEIRATKQGKRSIQELYEVMLCFWNRLAKMEPSDLSSSTSYLEYREEHRLLQFLVALRDEFEPLRNSILCRVFPPSVQEAVNELKVEETIVKSLKRKRLGYFLFCWFLLLILHFPSSTPSSSSSSVADQPPVMVEFAVVLMAAYAVAEVSRALYNFFTSTDGIVNSNNNQRNGVHGIGRGQPFQVAREPHSKHNESWATALPNPPPSHAINVSNIRARRYDPTAEIDGTPTAGKAKADLHIAACPKGADIAQNAEFYSHQTATQKDHKIKILTYNVWSREDVELHKRMKAVSDLIELHSPDVICFQEVTSNIYDIFKLFKWWKAYRCSVSNEMAKSQQPSFCVQLSKLAWTAFGCRRLLSTSKMERELSIAEFEVSMGKRMTVATCHLKRPDTKSNKFSWERVDHAKAALNLLKNSPNVIFCGDMNWDDELDGEFPLFPGWVDAWTELRAGERGWTYDTESNPMLAGNQPQQKRLDRFICRLKDFKLRTVDIIGMEAIPGLSYCEKKWVGSRARKPKRPVLPSDHYGLLLEVQVKDEWEKFYEAVLQGILINGQFPGPQIDCVTNDNLIISIYNYLNEPFLISWNGLQQRRNSWQDGVFGTSCPIPPGKNFTYMLQAKDQIGSFFYFPSLAFHKAAGGFGGIKISSRPRIPVPFPPPAGDYTVLTGDWFKRSARELKLILDSGHNLPFPDGLLINGRGWNGYTFTVDQGRTYRFRISNVGLTTSINFRIQGHTMKLVEVEGSHTLQNTYSSLDIHLGQSYSVLVTADQPAKDYYIVVSSRFTSPVLTTTAVLHYSNSYTGVSGPPPGGPTIQVAWSLSQARSIRYFSLFC